MPDSNEMKISISSPPDRKFLVAEFCVENEQIAEINRENNKLRIEIYSKESGKPWEIDYEELIETFNEAKRKSAKRSDGL